jgi:metal-dependent amidase/aminoacylase/carboxypeptidase family protein
MLQQLIDAIAEHKAALREVSNALWNNPETAYKEIFAARTAAAYLEKCGFEVTGNYCGIETAFRCEFSNGEGPVFAVASEYDALPEIGHGCGHNLICVAGMAAFLATVKVMKANSIPGKIILLGTFPEEGEFLRIARKAADYAGAVVNTVTDGAMITRREGDGRTFEIAAAIGGKDCEYRFDGLRKDLLTDQVYDGCIQLMPYQIAVLEAVKE